MALLKLITAVLAAALLGVNVNAQDLDCDPCIQREKYRIETIVHGTKDDPFWTRIQSGAIQAGKDFGIDLIFSLYDTFDPDQQAADIRDAVSRSNPPSALIVTIPDDTVASAVSDAVRSGVPVFGYNSGYKIAIDLGAFAWVAQDDYLGGVAAAKEFVSTDSNITTALFINHEQGNSGLTDRYNGFQTILSEETNATIVSVNVNSGLTGDNLTAALSPLFDGCPYDIILLAGSFFLGDVLSFKKNCPNANLGTFDQNVEVFNAITDGDLLFTVSQESYLQAAIPVLLATSYVTTGKIPATPLEGSNGIFLAGPSVTNAENVPSAMKQICLNDAFPVCPNTFAPDGSESACPCTDRGNIKVGGVLHGVTTDAFWDPVFFAAETAARDMGVRLDLDRFASQETDEILHLLMTSKIASLCDEGVDGLFVTIPSDAVLGSIQRCQELGVPIIVVNAGAQTVEDLGLLHYMGQLEFNSGYGAGKQLIAGGMVKGWCLNHEPSTQTTVQRCEGMKQALEEVPGLEYMGQIVVSRDNASKYRLDVESTINDDGDWDGYGLLLTGSIQVPPAVALLGDHPKAIIGTFDLSDDVFAALENGLIRFGIDQQPYLQGYLPVPLLTYFAYTRERLGNRVVESGPSFVLLPPDSAQQICEDNHYDVCLPNDPRLNPPTPAPTEIEATKDSGWRLRWQIPVFGSLVMCLLCIID